MKPITVRARHAVPLSCSAAARLLLVAAGLVLAAACGTTSAPPPTSAPTPTLSVEQVTPTPTVPAATSPAASAPVGHQAGNHIPDFAMRLADGSAVTSEELVNQRQPTMLFFFATW